MYASLDSFELAFKRLTGSRLGLLRPGYGRLEVTTLNEFMASLIEREIDFNPARLRMTQAMFDPKTENIVFFADRVQSGREESVILHELVHKNAHKVLLPEHWSGLVAVLRGWANLPDDSLARQIHDWAAERALADTRGRPGVFEEEFLAYGVEASVRFGVRPSAGASEDVPAGWLARAQAVLRKVIDAQLGERAGHVPEFTPEDLVDLAYAFARMESDDTGEVRRRLFHMSSLANRASIAREGLRVDRDRTGHGGVFLTSHPGQQQGMDTYEVDVTDLEVLPDTTTEAVDGEAWFVAYQDIGPARLERLPNQAAADKPLPIHGRAYPLASRDDWYGEGTYRLNGGRLVGVNPARYLACVRPLVMDEESRENIDLLKAHILSGKTLDPLLIRADGREDGRHRAHAALELGIEVVPVIAFGERFAGAESYPEAPVSDGQVGEGSSRGPDNGLRRAMAVTDTPEFRAWFRSSKVVDQAGRPLMVFHGTLHDIEGGVFKDRTCGPVKMAFYTDSIDAADAYARSFENDYVDGSNVVPVYLSLQNPKVVDYADQDDDREVRADAYLAEEEGYDGFIALNAFDGHSVANQYVVFNPAQIKSAIGNIGAFNPDDPSILRSLAIGASKRPSPSD